MKQSRINGATALRSQISHQLTSAATSTAHRGGGAKESAATPEAVPIRKLMEKFMKGKEASSALANYDRHEKLGEGTYGVVYRATHKPSKTVVALKKIRLDNEDQGIPATTLREVACLKEFQHENIVHLSDTIMNNGSLWLVFEYVQYDLRRYMEKAIPSGEKIPLPTVKSFMRQILVGIDFMHARRYLHRDLKPQNILVSRSGAIKIADFGLARLIGCPIRILTHEIVTLWYRAPEVLLGNHDTPYGTGVDVWSIGCIFAELFLMKPAFEGDSEIDQLYQIFRVLGTPSDDCWSDIRQYPSFNDMFPAWQAKGIETVLPATAGSSAVDLIGAMLRYTPAARIQCSEALKHDYIKDVPATLPAAPTTRTAPLTTAGKAATRRAVFFR